MLATAHYSCPYNAVLLVAQCELIVHIKVGYLLEVVGVKFSYSNLEPTVGVVRWSSVGDTAGYRLRRPKLTPVSLISMGRSRNTSANRQGLDKVVSSACPVQRCETVVPMVLKLMHPKWIQDDGGGGIILNLSIKYP